jgi:general secretion pathway protein K
MMSDRETEKGVILIALLWIMIALSVIAMSFARESFVEVSVARNTRDLAVAYYVARAGIAATVYQLWQKRSTPRVKQLELATGPDPIDLGLVSGEFADGVYQVEIQDESGKINLNYATEEQLRRLMNVVGILSPEADVIADSILDWRDVDNEPRANGAEQFYYEALSPPYEVKNGRLDTVEELLLVQGVTPDYYYGHKELAEDGSVLDLYGLSKYFTVYSPSNRINVNYAPLPVLLSVPDMPPEAAQMIFERRQSQPFASVEEITKELTVPLSTTTLPYLSTAQTGVYRLTAAAHRKGSKVRRVIRTVLSLDARETSRYRVIYWNENVPNF